jgi:hypothetical protein
MESYNSIYQIELTTYDINLNDAKILRPQSQVDDCVTIGGRVSGILGYSNIKVKPLLIQKFFFIKIKSVELQETDR